MSINENQEFEAINQKVKERTESVEEIWQCAADTYHEVKARKKAKAIAKMFAVVAVFICATFGLIGLEYIGWISVFFRQVLICVAGCMAMFKLCYFWHEIKN